MLVVLCNFEGCYFYVDLCMKENDWFIVEYDDYCVEELILQLFEMCGFFLMIYIKNFFFMFEMWLSFDCVEDCSDVGSFVCCLNYIVFLQYFDVDIDLMKVGCYLRQGFSGVYLMDVVMILWLCLCVWCEGIGVLCLQIVLCSWILSVCVGGDEVVWVCYDIGVYDLLMDDCIVNLEFVVFFEQLFFEGDEVEIEVEIEFEFFDYVEGLSWYLIFVVIDFEVYMVEFDFCYCDCWGVIIMGCCVLSEWQDDGICIICYEVDGVSVMIGFFFVEMLKIFEQQMVFGKLVKVFGMMCGFMIKKCFDMLSKDVVEILDYFEEFFGGLIVIDEFIVGFVENGVQVFFGYVQFWNGVMIDGGVIGLNDYGFKEYFVVYEFVYFWWGYQVGWVSDCDYWFVEVFVEYIVFFFVESEVECGDCVVECLLCVYINLVIGLIKFCYDSFVSWGFVLGVMMGCDWLVLFVYGVCVCILEMLGGVYLIVY